MKYTIVVIIVFLITNTTFADGTAEISDEPITLVWSATCPPDGIYSKAMTTFKMYIESRTSIAVEIYTAGENLINITETGACIEGLIDLTYFDSSYFEDKLPYLKMLNAAFLFNDYEHMTEVLNGEIGYEIYNEIAEVSGIRPLGAFYLGAGQLNLVERAGEIRTPFDMRNIRIPCKDNRFSIARIRAIGGIPVPYSDFKEIYPWILNGIVDGQDNELLIYKTGRFYELTKYIVLTNHYLKTVWPVINEHKWQQMNLEQQKIIMEAVRAAEEVCSNYILQLEQEAIDYFTRIGFIIIDDPDLYSFTLYSRIFYINNSISDGWDIDLYNEIRWLR